MKELVAGVDGCISGWVIALAPLDELSKHEWTVRKSFKEILELKEKPSVIMIDIPIGLKDIGPRQCDIEAREKLNSGEKKRGSSVFPAPNRKTLEKGSRQTQGILKKVIEVDEVMKQTKSELLRGIVVKETHPELCFWAMKGGNAMESKKTKEEGREKRLELLKKIFPGFDKRLKKYPKGILPDIIDSYACLWTAIQYKRGKADSVPKDKSEKDITKGLRMEIWYPSGAK